MLLQQSAQSQQNRSCEQGQQQRKERTMTTNLARLCVAMTPNGDVGESIESLTKALDWCGVAYRQIGDQIVFSLVVPEGTPTDLAVWWTRKMVTKITSLGHYDFKLEAMRCGLLSEQDPPPNEWFQHCPGTAACLEPYKGAEMPAQCLIGARPNHATHTVPQPAASST